MMWRGVILRVLACRGAFFMFLSIFEEVMILAQN